LKAEASAKLTRTADIDEDGGISVEEMLDMLRFLPVLY
jgi:Ca2+-binding EF-hand superfamily protein